MRVVKALVILAGTLESGALRCGNIGVEPELSTVRTWRNGFASVKVEKGLRSDSVTRFVAFGDRRVWVDFVCFKVELTVGARALLPLLGDMRGIRDDCRGETGVLPWLVPAPALLAADVKTEVGLRSTSDAEPGGGILKDSSGLEARV